MNGVQGRLPISGDKRSLVAVAVASSRCGVDGPAVTIACILRQVHAAFNEPLLEVFLCARTAERRHDDGKYQDDERHARDVRQRSVDLRLSNSLDSHVVRAFRLVASG